MQSKSIYKAGKLIKISLDYNSDQINKINIDGDFFLYPEEGRENLENALAGTRLEKTELIKKIESIIADKKIEVHGFSPEQLSEAILLAVQNSGKGL